MNKTKAIGIIIVIAGLIIFVSGLFLFFQKIIWAIILVAVGILIYLFKGEIYNLLK